MKSNLGSVAFVVLAVIGLCWLLAPRNGQTEDDVKRHSTHTTLSTLARIDGEKHDSIAHRDDLGPLLRAAADLRRGEFETISDDWFNHSRENGIQGLDGWGRPIILTWSRGVVHLSSGGADGVHGTRDDVSFPLFGWAAQYETQIRTAPAEEPAR